MKKNILIPTLLLAALAGGAAWWNGQRSHSDTSAAPGAATTASGARSGPQSVSVVRAQQRDVPVTVEAAGTVVALDSVELRPQLSAVVRTVHVREGQFVRKGELMFSFDDSAERANLEKVRAQLQRDRVTLADLERQLKRALELRAQNFIAQSSADTLQTQVEAQRAAIQSDEAAIQASQVTLGYSQLRAPLSGRVGAISINPGSLVQPSGAALATINQIDPIGVSFTLPEAQLGAVLRSVGIRKDRPAKGAAAASAAGGAPEAALSVLLPSERGGRQPGEALPGQLFFVDNAIDTATGTIRVKGALANARQQLWPGQYVTARLALRQIQDAIVIPQVALIQRGNERSVYVVGEDGLAQLRPVQSRYPFGELVVVEGLQAGEKVVTEGKQNLRPGTPVREVTPGAKAASGAGAAASAAAAASEAGAAASGASR
ncbi:MAG: hypothetical protein RJA44_320 [Pseudomonadota bacterium]